MKLSKGHNDFAIVAVGSLLTFASDNVCRAASVVLGGVAPTPIHAKNAENVLIGRKLEDKVIEEASQKASDDLSPPSDLRASAEYRLEMAKVLTERAVRNSASRALGSN